MEHRIMSTADPAQIVLHVVGEPLLFPENVWRNDSVEAARWIGALWEVVRSEDPWAMLGQRPDGDVMVFDTSESGVAHCADWATRVWFMYPKGAYTG